MLVKQPQQELNALADQLHIYEDGERFKIVGSDLEFRYNVSPGDTLWQKASCVTPGKTAQGFEHKHITILTQGSHAVSPHLNLPYFCYFQGDFPGDSFSIVSRHAESVIDATPIIDVRNPYKPRRRTRETIIDSINKANLPPGRLFSRYGELTYRIYDASLHDRVAIYIESMGVIANVFKTRPHGTFELQCIFNVGNSFDQIKSFPVRYFNGFLARPIVTLRSGEFTESGTWENTRPSIPLATPENTNTHCHYCF